MNELFEQTFKIEIDGTKIPKANAQKFVNALSKLCNVFCHSGEGDPVWMNDVSCIEDTFDIIGDYPPAEAVSAATGVRPKKKVFHAERHTRFSADQNIQLQKIMPMITALKKKGVK